MFGEFLTNKVKYFCEAWAIMRKLITAYKKGSCPCVCKSEELIICGCNQLGKVGPILEATVYGRSSKWVGHMRASGHDGNIGSEN